MRKMSPLAGLLASLGSEEDRETGGFYGLFGEWNFGALGSGISTADA
uniref:Uncharacterized protein n=1 Tax=Arundo donax TaxID=35708 RepID=A0A0A9EH48_ARUDO